ncbi:MAG: ribose 5-phosphate isomerase B [Chitinophagaceae bacterium]
MLFNTSLPIALGADHAGVEYKAKTIEWLHSKGLATTNFGTNDTTSVDYPDFAHPVAQAVENNEAAFGILFCGSANGVAITANKHQNIRAGLAWQNDVAKLIRMHNNANIICIPARFVALPLALEMIENFMSTAFEGGRHQNRIDKINC